MTRQPLLAICVRIHIAAVAIIEKGTVVEVYRRYFQFTPKSLSREMHLAKLIRRIIHRHRIVTVVVEPGCIGEKAVKLLGREPVRLRMKKAKAILLAGVQLKRHRDLYEHLIERDPRLVRFVRLLSNGAVATNDDERFRTINLLAAGLGLAAAVGDRSN